MAFGGAGLARRSSNASGNLGAVKATASEPRAREKSRREKRESAISRSSGFDRMIRSVRPVEQENATFLLWAPACTGTDRDGVWPLALGIDYSKRRILWTRNCGKICGKL